MPTYEYRCPQGHEFERFFRTISGAPTEVTCPECHAVASRQLSAGGGLLFKGSGFYLTDYGKNAHRSGTDGKKAEGQKPESAKAEGSKGEGSKAESKSESAPKTEGSAKAESPKPAADTSKKPKSE